LPRVVSGGESCNIRDILAEFLFAVEVEARKRLISVILRGERGPRLVEMGKVRRSPPVPELAARIDRRSEIVEAVTDFVPDDGADRSVFRGAVRRRLVKALV